MADGVVLHTNSGVHIGLAPLVCSMVDGGQSASMLRAAALLRALPPLAASFPRPAVNSKQRTEMAEDATAVESSLASLQAEQPELFVAVTQAGIGESPDPRGLCLGTDSLVGDDGHPANGSTEPSCGQAEVDGGMVFGSGVEQVRGATYPVIPLRTAALPVVGEEAAPLTSTDLPTSSLPHDVDGGVGGLDDLLASDDPFFHPGCGDRQQEQLYADSSVSSELGAESLGSSEEGAQLLSRGLGWLRSAWRDIIKRRILSGPRRRGEADYDLLTRVGFWHDDRCCEDGFGWADAVDMGFEPGYLGGRVFQPISPSLLDAAWARAAWQRALRTAQAHLMGARGQAWLALRAAERVQRAAFRDLCWERRFSVRAWPAVRSERAGKLACAEAAYLRATRRSEAYRIELRAQAGADRRGRRRGRRGPGLTRSGRG